MKTNLCDSLARLGVSVPIFQAPIGGIATADLAAEVSNAGGIGNLACTWLSPNELEQLIGKVRALTAKPFGVNFVLAFPIEKQLDVALRCGVPIVSFFWGDGSKYLARVKAANAVAIQVVGTVEEAITATKAGFDLIVAQGREAGGHVRGKLGTMALVPQVVDIAATTPVIAAGGISDRRGVKAAIALGASGVWVGTRFLAATEANIHPVYLARVLASTGSDTLYSKVFDGGWNDAPLRTLRNSTIAAWESAGCPTAPHRPGESDVIGHRADGSGIPRYHSDAPKRGTTGQVEDMALYAGEAVGLVRSTEPAARIIAELALGL